jgi:hypothetical protein
MRADTAARPLLRGSRTSTSVPRIRAPFPPPRGVARCASIYGMSDIASVGHHSFGRRKACAFAAAGAFATTERPSHRAR